MANVKVLAIAFYHVANLRETVSRAEKITQGKQTMQAQDNFAVVSVSL